MMQYDSDPIYVLDRTIPYSSYVPIDLSVNNSGLKNIRLNDPADFGKYIDNYLAKENALVAYGGYNEKRNLYKTSSIFAEAESDRDIHIGLDLWSPAGTTVLAAEKGTVHSFANNHGIGNYGPTIILHHITENEIFYTLYGHLSLESLENLTVGETFHRGQAIGTLGEAAVNGNYPPHLHFQLIREIGSFSADYPGVCSAKNREYYLQNCPNPNLLLKIN